MEAQVKSIRTPKKAANEKREKFVLLAQSRTVNAIKAIRVIGKLGNKSHYQYDEKDVKKIARTLQRELDLMKLRFAGGSQGGDGEFSL